MSKAKVCWDWDRLLNAAQVDVGALTVGDPKSDAVFLAVHESVPIKKGSGDIQQVVDEQELLATFTANRNVNEPLILLITGDVGSGKSHMVRWLNAAVGQRTDWHSVYISKRNTSLTRVIERVIDGLDSDTISKVRMALDDASSQIKTLEEATLRLVNEVRTLMKTDESDSLRIRALDDSESVLKGAVLKTARDTAEQLLGDLVLSNHLKRPDGPFERIANLAMPQMIGETENSIHENDIRFSPSDLSISLEDVHDLNQAAASAINRLANEKVKNAVAQLLDHYLPIAKARVFTGRSTDLLRLFEDVRREIKNAGQELCLYIEDLVLLHGIDNELAQALTTPADEELCKVRAAIAVTDGYLGNVATFTDRGVRYTMNVEADYIGVEQRRSFVARYLNASRIDDKDLARVDRNSIPNGCSVCSISESCHETFGASQSGYGYFPFNEHALDRLIEGASGSAFRPRKILREVLRAGVEVADAELRSQGVFPSRRFGSNIDQNRKLVPTKTQALINKQSDFAEQETSLRNFFASQPPARDAGLDAIASFLGIALADLADDETIIREVPPSVQEQPQAEKGDEFDNWFHKDKRLAAGPANTIRKWFFGQLHRRLENQPNGHLVSKQGDRLSIGAISVRQTEIVRIDNAAGAGRFASSDSGPAVRITSSAENATMIASIVAASEGNYEPSDNAAWYFRASSMVDQVAGELVALADEKRLAVNLRETVSVLRLCERISGLPIRNDSHNAQGLFILPGSIAETNRAKFANRTNQIRVEKLGDVKANFAQAQGSGAPSILDGGLFWGHLTKTRNLKQLDDTGGNRELETIRSAQQEYASKRWAPLTQSCKSLSKSITPDDDLELTFKEMHEVINVAHTQGWLPRQDTKESFLQLVENLDFKAAQSSLNFVSKHCDSSNLESLVWELDDSAEFQLKTLEALLEITNTTLAHILARIEEKSEPDDAVGRNELITAFETLTKTLQDMDSY